VGWPAYLVTWGVAPGYRIRAFQAPAVAGRLIDAVLSVPLSRRAGIAAWNGLLPFAVQSAIRIPQCTRSLALAARQRAVCPFAVAVCRSHLAFGISHSALALQVRALPARRDRG
jgi:hypothetical protein